MKDTVNKKKINQINHLYLTRERKGFCSTGTIHHIFNKKLRIDMHAFATVACHSGLSAIAIRGLNIL